MLFNSIEYAFFLPIVFILYWFVFNKHLKWQNFFLLLVSYIFYGWWDWRFLTLIAFSSFTDYFVAINMGRATDPRIRKSFLWLSLLVNLGLLGFFKYYNFFIDSFSDLISLFGLQPNPNTLNLILPVGISFYTFQTLSYTIDVYRGKITPTKDFVAFFAYVSFFPQLVAGPIERAGKLLPQFFKKRTFSYDAGRDGLKQILWGLVKKMVIADNAAIYVDQIFANSAEASGGTLILGAILFSFQIYGDFSGYTDIAIGSARLMGFELSKNFSYPYFSRDIAEFWRRWHISLSTWFKDYLYFPLGGSRGSSARTVRNVFIVFVVSGFWHGANWTFICWGLMHALFYLPLLIFGINRTYLTIAGTGKGGLKPVEVLQMMVTFMLSSLAWVMFRSVSVNQALDIYRSMLFSPFEFETPEPALLVLLLLIAVFLLVEWAGRRESFAIAVLFDKSHRFVRWTFYFVLMFVIFMFATTNKEFIYFQF